MTGAGVSPGFAGVGVGVGGRAAVSAPRSAPAAGSGTGPARPTDSRRPPARRARRGSAARLPRRRTRARARGSPRVDGRCGTGCAYWLWRTRSLGSTRDRHRDRPCQARSPRLLLRRHRDRALAAHPRPGGGQHRLADRRLPLRDPGAGRADGLGDVAGHRHRAGPDGRTRGAQPRGPLDPLRGPDRPAGGGGRAGGCRRHPPDAGHLRRADQARAHHRPAEGRCEPRA